MSVAAKVIEPLALQVKKAVAHFLSLIAVRYDLNNGYLLLSSFRIYSLAILKFRNDTLLAT